MAGYSGTPLVKKLGIKAGFKVKIKNAPENYLELLGTLPEDVSIKPTFRKDVDLWHVFVMSQRELRAQLPVAIKQIKPNGMIWVSWPKKASGIVTDMLEDSIREAAFPLGLVDVKVCAVDATWSGLKLVIRKENRR
ncbi:MAG: DUF3052 family protein [Deinococcota bacterium]